MDYKVVFKAIGNPTFTFESDEQVYHRGLIDLETFEYSPDGFSAFIGEKPSIFNYIDASGDDVLISSPSFSNGLGNFDTRATFKDGVVDPGDYVYIDDEIIKIDSVHFGNTFNILRGQYGTRKMPHFYAPSEDEGIKVFIGGRWTPLGMEADIYDSDDKLIRKGYIKSLYSYQSGVHVEFGDLLDKLEVVITPPVTLQYSHIYTLIRDMNVWGMNDVFRLVIPDYIRQAHIVSEIKEGASTFEFNAKDIIESLTKASMSVIVFKDGKYQFLNLLNLSAFNTASDVKIDNKLSFSGTIKTSLKIQTSSVHVEYSYKSESNYDIEFNDSYVRAKGTTTGGAIGGDMVHLDTKALLFSFDRTEAKRVARKIASRFIETFGFVIGEIEVNTNTYEYDGDDDVTPVFSAGEYYRPTDIKDEELFIIFFDSSIDVVLFCVGMEDGLAKFLILTSSEYNPVSPAMIMHSETTGTDKIKFKDGETAATFLFTEYDSLAIATHRFYNYKFFEVGDMITLFNLNNTGVRAYKISEVGSDYLRLMGYSSVNTNEYYITYPNQAVENSKQAKHLLLSGGVL